MTEVVMMELVFNDPRFLWDQTPLGLGQVAHSRNTLIQTWEPSSSIERCLKPFDKGLNCFQQRKGKKKTNPAPRNDTYNLLQNQCTRSLQISFLVLIWSAANILTISSQKSVNIWFTMNEVNKSNLYLARWNHLKYFRTDICRFFKTMTF